jgi:hypothetical protein
VLPTRSAEPGRSAGSLETSYGWVVAACFVLIAIGNASFYIAVVSLKPIAAKFGCPRNVPVLGVSRIGVGCMAASYSTSAWCYLSTHGVLVGLLGNAALSSKWVSNRPYTGHSGAWSPDIPLIRSWAILSVVACCVATSVLIDG